MHHPSHPSSNLRETIVVLYGFIFKERARIIKRTFGEDDEDIIALLAIVSSNLP
jgi:hypothetical protein